jgi:type II secretory pathway pseudopilin PulG
MENEPQPENQRAVKTKTTSDPRPMTLTGDERRVTGDGTKTHACESCPRPPAIRCVIAFTLIEMIGVLAVLAILAAAIAPVAIRHIDQAARTKEAADLQAISDALRLEILHTKTVPSETTWAQAVGDWLSRPPASITNNPRGRARVILLDTSGWFGTATLPNQQTINGTQAPANARLMLVSSIVRPLPAINARPGAAVFNDIWNTPAGAKPGTWTTWAGSGDDLLIQRISLDKLFHRLILVNRDPNNAARFSIDGTNTLAVPRISVAGTNWNAFYLDGTVVGLCNSNGVPVTRYVLTRDISFVFESDLWQGQLGAQDNSGVAGNNFANQAAAFLASAWSGGSHSADQQSVLLEMYTFMYDYTMWANENPRFNYHGISSASQVPEWMLLDGVEFRIGQDSGKNGLLK